MTTYQRETFKNVLPEAMPLLEAHWFELNNSPGVPLNANVDLYQQAEDNNGLLVFTARDNGKLVGYSAVFVHQGMYCVQQKQATQDVFYVVPECRGGMIGARLIRFAENELKNQDVQLVYNHSNIKNMLLGRLLEVLGYEPVSVVYQRRLT